MFTYASIETLYQVNFPKSQEGKLSDLRYTVYTVDSTGGYSEYIAQTNTDAEDFEDGAYGVKLTLPEGRYFIKWEILTTTYVANEDINVYENIYSTLDSTISKYSGYGLGNARFDSQTSESVILEFQFLRNGLNFNAYQAVKVEIYNTYAKAVTALPADITQTITSISNPSTGRYTYTMSPVTASGVYFDKIYLIPYVGEPTETFISSIYVGSEDLQGVTPGAREKVTVYLNIFDITDTPQKCDKVFVSMCNKYGKYSGVLIERNQKRFAVDVNGLVTMSLIETDTLTQDTGQDVFYKLTALDGAFEYIFTVPAGTVEANLLDLPVYTPTSDSP